MTRTYEICRTRLRAGIGTKLRSGATRSMRPAKNWPKGTIRSGPFASQTDLHLKTIRIAFTSTNIRDSAPISKNYSTSRRSLRACHDLDQVRCARQTPDRTRKKQFHHRHVLRLVSDNADHRASRSICSKLLGRLYSTSMPALSRPAMYQRDPHARSHAKRLGATPTPQSMNQPLHQTRPQRR